MLEWEYRGISHLRIPQIILPIIKKGEYFMPWWVDTRQLKFS